jgi:hypothetical protein
MHLFLFIQSSITGICNFSGTGLNAGDTKKGISMKSNGGDKVYMNTKEGP